jgi:hypothetical protein
LHGVLIHTNPVAHIFSGGRCDSRDYDCSGLCSSSSSEGFVDRGFGGRGFGGRSFSSSGKGVSDGSFSGASLSYGDCFSLDPKPVRLCCSSFLRGIRRLSLLCCFSHTADAVLLRDSVFLCNRIFRSSSLCTCRCFGFHTKTLSLGRGRFLRDQRFLCDRCCSTVALLLRSSVFVRDALGLSHCSSSSSSSSAGGCFGFHTKTFSLCCGLFLRESRFIRLCCRFNLSTTVFFFRGSNGLFLCDTLNVSLCRRIFRSGGTLHLSRSGLGGRF